MKKLFAIMLVFVMLLTQFAFPSFAYDRYGVGDIFDFEEDWEEAEDPYAGLTVKSIKVEATRELIENADGYVDFSYDDEKVFIYDLYYAELFFTVVFENGEEEVCPMSELYEGVYYEDSQYENPWGVGKHTVTGTYRDAEFSVEVEVIENPVKSVTAVAQKALVEGWDSYEDYYFDENDEEIPYVGYDLYSAEPVFTIVMKDGSVFTGTDEEIGEETGYFTYETTDQYENPLKVGKNTVTFVYMGVEFECEIEIISNPYESITISGENELVLEFKGVNPKDSFTTKIVSWDGMSDDGGAWGFVTTDNGNEYWMDYYCYMDDDGNTYLNKDVSLQIGSFTTNTLERNDWLAAYFTAEDVILYTMSYYSVSEEFTDEIFDGYFADAKEKDIDDLVAISTYICEMEPAEAEDSFLHTLSVKEVEENIELVFGLTDVDVTSSSFYDKVLKKVVLEEPFDSGIYYDVTDFTFKDGKWTATADTYYWDTDEFVCEVEVTINKDFIVECIDFTGKIVESGDVNCDGKVTAVDARLVLQYVAGLIDEFDVNMFYADMNEDGEITAVDARIILQKVVGLNK